jgi:hypothetical protein
MGISPGIRLALTDSKEGRKSSSGGHVINLYDPAQPVQSGGDAILMLPLLLTFRYGPDATITTTKTFGFGLAMGLREQLVTRNDEAYFYPTPVMLGELTFQPGIILKLQGVADLGKYQVDGDYLDARLSHWGIYFTFVQPLRIK